MTCTTGDCFRLEVAVIRTARANGWRSGTTTYSGAFYTHVLSWTVSQREGRPCLYYRWGEWEQGKQPVYCALYEEPSAAIGGRRLFRRCFCGRRVTVLYMPRGNLNWPGHDPVFACRHCYRLSYSSQHESAFDRLWRRFHEAHDALHDPKTPSPRFHQLIQQLDGLNAQIQAESQRTHALIERLQAPAAPPRSRGRPSKQKERERLRAARAAAKAEQPTRQPGRPREKRAYVRHILFVLSERRNAMQAFCPKCRDRREMIGGKSVTFSNGRPAVQGTCAVCGTRMARIVTRGEAAEAWSAFSST